MSEDIGSTLKPSSPGPLRPKKRPPLQRSASDSRNLSTELDPTEITKIDNSARDEQDLSHDNKNLNEGDDSTRDSVEENSSDNNSSKTVESDTEDSKNSIELERHYLTNVSTHDRNSSVSHGFLKKYIDESNSNTKNNIPADKVNSNAKNNTPGIGNLFLGAALFLLFSCCSVYILSEQNPLDLDKIKEAFPTQSEDLWVTFESGVNEIITFNRPSTFIFLYKKEAEDTLENLLKKLTKYAACNLTHCSKEPLIVTDTELNSADIVEDYGRVIEKYKNKLEESGVMVIKNLQNVKGVSAQAFHSFCDEVTPLVARSLFIFTMQVDILDGQNEMQFVEEFLKNKWTDIKIDTFNALITRISSMVLEIKP